MELNKRIDKFAELAIRTGINVQKGETLLIRADIQAYDFARRCAKEAYKAGAKHVYVEYSDEVLLRENYLLAPSESFDEFPQWTADKYTEIAKEGGSFLSIVSANPDLLKGIDTDRISRYQKASGKALKEWRSYTLTDKAKWSIVAVPSETWAKLLHPDLEVDEAMEKLWTEILDCSRVTENPTEAWNMHVNNIKSKMDTLNKLDLDKLIYESSKTDLEIGLPEGHIWQGGSAVDPKNVEFCPNIPTEEVYGMPHKYKVDGIVYSTKPLIFSGNTIDNFWLKFKDGKIVDYKAEVGHESLKLLIETDEGSLRLGEMALVAYDSPISNTNIIFYNTLFDENASCHLAIGAAYSSNIENGDSLSEDEQENLGMNSSLTHVDFMIGDSDLNITGIDKNGKAHEIFKNGNWAF